MCAALDGASKTSTHVCRHSRVPLRPTVGQGWRVHPLAHAVTGLKGCLCCRVMQTVVTADVVNYDATRKFDRVMSIEMFEHMKNYQVCHAWSKLSFEQQQQ